jgi:hypothetical protein
MEVMIYAYKQGLYSASSFQSKFFVFVVLVKGMIDIVMIINHVILSAWDVNELPS